MNTPVAQITLRDQVEIAPRADKDAGRVADGFKRFADTLLRPSRAQELSPSATSTEPNVEPLARDATGRTESAKGKSEGKSKADRKSAAKSADAEEAKAVSDPAAEIVSKPLTIDQLNQFLLQIDPTLAARGLIPGVNGLGPPPPDPEFSGATDSSAATDSEKPEVQRSNTELVAADGGREHPSKAASEEQPAPGSTDPASSGHNQGSPAPGKTQADNSGHHDTDGDAHRQAANAPTASAPVPATSTAVALHGLDQSTLTKRDTAATPSAEALPEAKPIQAIDAGASSGGATLTDSRSEPQPGTVLTAQSAQRTAPSAESAKLLEAQIARGFGAALQQNGTERSVTLRMSPESLGHVRIELRVEDGTVSVRFDADKPAAHRLLEESLPALTRSLNERGLDVVDMHARLVHQEQTGVQSPVAERPNDAGGFQLNHSSADSQGRDGTSGQAGEPHSQLGRSPNQRPSSDAPGQRATDSPAAQSRSAVDDAGHIFLRLDAVA